MRQEKHRQFAGNQAERALEVIGAVRSVCELVVQACDPKLVAAPAGADGIVYQEVNAGLFETPPDLPDFAGPPIVIAKNREDAGRRDKLAERRHPFGDGNRSCAKARP